MNISKFDWNIFMRLAHSALGKEKPKYSCQYFTIAIALLHTAPKCSVHWATWAGCPCKCSW